MEKIKYIKEMKLEIVQRHQSGASSYSLANEYEIGRNGDIYSSAFFF